MARHILLLVFCGLANVAHGAPVPWPQKGMTFTNGKYCPFVKFDSALADTSLRNIRAVGANWVTLVVTMWQPYLNSTTLYRSGLQANKLTATDAQLLHAIQRAHALGMRVMLKPHVDAACTLDGLLPASNEAAACGLPAGGCGTWRGCIGVAQGADFPAFGDAQWAAWFESYQENLVHYARLAQGAGVEQFSIGCELQGSTSAARDAEWRSVAAAVRAVYNGTLTYASNWGGDETNIEWWDALDLIGVDAYYPLPNTNCSKCTPPTWTYGTNCTACLPNPNPTKAQLVQAWRELIETGVANGYQGEAMSFGLRALHDKFQKPILFTEVGYCSTFRGTYASTTQCTGSATSSPPNATMQALRYEALLDAWRDVPWFEGVHWWNWDTDANFGGLANSCLSPQGKPAQTLLRRAYGGTGDLVPPSGAPVCPCIDT